jgi:hypothetical protein
VRVERFGIDDHPGIHPMIGVENRFELAKGWHQVVTEHSRQQLGSRDTVAVFTGQRATEFGYQIAQVEHRSAELADALGREKIEVDSAVHAALAEVAVVRGRREIIARQQRHQTPQEVA